MISKFLDLKSGSSLCVCVGFLLPQTQTYIRLILKAVKYRYSDQVLNFSIRSYCVCTPLGFVTKYFLIFIADEVKNFVANNNHSSCWSQLHNRIHAKELVTNQRFVHQRKKKSYYKIKSNQVLEQKFNYRLIFWDRLGQLVRFLILITA